MAQQPNVKTITVCIEFKVVGFDVNLLPLSEAVRTEADKLTGAIGTGSAGLAVSLPAVSLYTPGESSC